MATPAIGLSTSLVSISTSLFSPRGGCMIVDSTRKGKRFPDSMSKTIPIWTCVLNRAIFNYRSRISGASPLNDKDPDTLDGLPGETSQCSSGWDCSLHLPLWVSETETALIEDRLEGWTKELEASGVDIGTLSSRLKKPLRPLWISQKTVIWLNEVPECDSWDFTPIILVSASSSSGKFQHLTTSEFSWNYIPGAGDDEESWARGLTPNLFWKHAYDLIRSDPDSCNHRVAELVEKDRVSRARRGEIAPQISVKPSKCPARTNSSAMEQFKLGIAHVHEDMRPSSNDTDIFWLGSSSLAVGSTQCGIDFSCVDSILNCGTEPLSIGQENPEVYLHIPIVSSKFDRFCLLRNLPCALDFAKMNLREKKRLLVCCSTGEDISTCVCLAILTTLFDESGNFDDGKSFSETRITKSELRQRLVFICGFSINARPSRGNLKQVFNCLTSGNVGSVS